MYDRWRDRDYFALKFEIRSPGVPGDILECKGTVDPRLMDGGVGALLYEIDRIADEMKRGLIANHDRGANLRLPSMNLSPVPRTLTEGHMPEPMVNRNGMTIREPVIRLEIGRDGPTNVTAEDENGYTNHFIREYVNNPPLLAPPIAMDIAEHGERQRPAHPHVENPYADKETSAQRNQRTHH